MPSYVLGEFLGTAFLVLFGCGASATFTLGKSKGGSHPSWLAIAAGWGLGATIAIFVAKSTGSIQADINPAVTVGKYVLGGIYSFWNVCLIIPAQILGGFFGAVLLWIAYSAHWQETKDPHVKRGVFVTSPAIRKATGANFINEMIGTFVLVFGIGAIYGKATNGQIPPDFSPYLVGLLIGTVILSLGGSTGYAINPARDLGPRIAYSILPIPSKGSSDWDYAWIPVAAPLLGGIIGGLLWKILL